MQQLSMLDNGMLAMESPRTPNHLCMVQVYDPATSPGGPVSFDEVLKGIAENLPAAPSLRRKLVRVPLDLDNPYWVEDADFDLEFHVRQLALPHPGDWRQFRTQVARLHSRALDLSRPPWEATMIEGLNGIAGIPAGSFALVIKVHHAAIDGVSGVELLNAIHTTSPAGDSLNGDDPAGDDAGAGGTSGLDRWQPDPVPTPWTLMRWAGLHAVTRPVSTVRYLGSNGGPIVRNLPRALGRRGPQVRVTRTRFNQRVSAHRVFDDVQVPLADMRRMKRGVPGATINDLCLCIVGGAMQRYLAAKDEPPEAPLVAMVPISTRTADQVGTGGNQVAMLRTSLHTDISDPLARLAAIRESTSELKAAQQGMGARSLTELSQFVPGALVGIAMRAVSAVARNGPLIANTVVTNVPGAPQPLYFRGAKVIRITGCVPLSDGLGLFHCVSSYTDTFTFIFTACRELLPDPEFYRSCLEASIAELDAATQEPPAAARTKRAAGKRAPARQTPAKKTRTKTPAAKKQAATKKAPARKTPAREAVTSGGGVRRPAARP